VVAVSLDNSDILPTDPLSDIQYFIIT
jgi:hypothetical protein